MKEGVIMALKKVVVNMEEELLKKIDDYSFKLHISRTATISVICSMYLDGLNAMASMSQFSDEIKKLSDKS